MILNFIKDIHSRQTWVAYTATRLLNAPFWILHVLLPFILTKDLHATPWQIACLVSLRPVISLLSWYWSTPIQRRRDRLLSNIVVANILGHLPFLFVPLISDVWFFIFASAIYTLFNRGVNPAWMEILKINVPEESRRTLFALGSSVYHVGGGLLAILTGWLLDDYLQAWRWLFPLTALLALSASFVQWKLPIKQEMQAEEKISSPFSFTKPWKDAWQLMKQRPDFLHFQIGFMLGGGGLMLWQPALPQFFFTVLKLNYTELSLAMTLCKSIGYTLALPLWTRAMSRLNIFIFSAAVTAIAALFPFSLMAAEWHLVWLYVAYILYGIMQAGSEMSWNLSGPIFSKQEDSSIYSGVNVMTIGLRGCLAPTLGGLLCQWTNVSVVLVLGGILCLLATWQMGLNRQKEKVPSFLS